MLAKVVKVIFVTVFKEDLRPPTDGDEHNLTNNLMQPLQGECSNMYNDYDNKDVPHNIPQYHKPNSNMHVQFWVLPVLKHKPPTLQSLWHGSTSRHMAAETLRPLDDFIQQNFRSCREMYKFLF